MSRTNRRPAPRDPEAPAAAPAPTHDVHPLFFGEEDEPTPSAIAFECITVHRQSKNGEKEALETVPADELPDLATFRDRFGAGLFYLVARDLRGRIAGRVLLRVGVVHAPTSPAETEPSSAETAGAAPKTPSDLVHTLFMALVQQSREHQAQVIQAITQLAGARMADQQTMIEALTQITKGRSAAAPAAGMSPLEVLKIFKDGQAQILEFLEANGGEGKEDDIAELLKSFVGGVKAVKETSEAVT